MRRLQKSRSTFHELRFACNKQVWETSSDIVQRSKVNSHERLSSQEKAQH